MTQLLPIWALEGGTQPLLQRLADGESRKEIASQTEDDLANRWEDIVLAFMHNPDQLDMNGMTLQQVADERGCTGVEAALVR